MSFLCSRMPFVRRLPGSFWLRTQGSKTKVLGWTLTNDSQILTVCGNTSVCETSQIMKDNHIGSVLVMDGGNVTGIFTDRDVVTFAAKNGESTEAVKYHMTSFDKFVTVTPENSLNDMMNLMLEHNIRHIPMVDRRKREMLRMVSVKDVVNSTINELEQEVKDLRWFIQL